MVNDHTILRENRPAPRGAGSTSRNIPLAFIFLIPGGRARMSRHNVPPSTILSSWTPRNGENKPKDSVSHVLRETLESWLGVVRSKKVRCTEAVLD